MNKLTVCMLGLFLLGGVFLGPLFAEEVNVSELTSQLKAISDKQDQIITTLAEIKNELNIVKVRTTLNG